MTPRLRILLALSAGLLVFTGSGHAAGPAPVTFSRDILPILSDKCFFCHGPDEKARKARLRLDKKDGAYGAGKSGEIAVVPGQPSKSELVRRILTKDEDDLMPPPSSNRKLTPQQAELLQRWVAQGAPWGKHWAYEPPQRPPLPDVKNKRWVRNPIDQFVLARLEQEKLTPSPEAAKETLIRRVTLDLTGLPPTPAEVDAFLKDRSKDAYEKLVDRLLASPHYGERMAWEWLDAARYADTNGYQGDNTRTMWPWRDWAIRALNENLPFDQFTIQQLAGDLLPNATRDQKIATGFCRNHMINGEGGRIPEENRIDYVFDQTETMTTIWLGVTFGCARCHDHKYDPFTQKEYYQLFAFFNNTPVNGGGGSGQTKPLIDFTTPEEVAKLKEFDVQIKELAKPVEAIEKDLFPRAENQMAAASPKAATVSGNVLNELKRTPEKRSVFGLREMVNVYKDTQPAYSAALEHLKQAMEHRQQYDGNLTRVMVMEELPKPREAFVLVRGAYDKHAAPVVADVPASLSEQAVAQPENRLTLARWLVSPENPLTARVTVNRYWQLFFGTGLVKTVDDFGVQGERPSHPELLDWLATEFVRSGWNVKAMHKLIVMSATYRQSSKTTPALHERDPENRLLAHGPRYRLPSWMLRDQALAVSGLFTDKLGGPSVKPYQPEGIWEEATFGQIKYQQDHGDALYRRSLYIFWRRIVGPTMFFDNATRQTCTVKALHTNTPLHALTTLNDVTYVEAARAFAQRLLETGGKTDAARIDTAFHLALSRSPSTTERKILLHRLDVLKQQYATDAEAAQKLLKTGESPRDEKLNTTEHAAWTGLCSLILNLDETLSKE